MFGFDLGTLPDPSFPEIIVQAYNYASTNPSSSTVQNTYNYDLFWRDVQVNYVPYPAGGLIAKGLASTVHNGTIPKPTHVMPN